MANILTCYYRPKPGGFCRRLFRAMGALLTAGHTVHYLAVEPFPIDHCRCVFHRFPWPRKNTENLVFWMVFHLFAPLMLLAIGVCSRTTHLFAFGPNYAFLLQPLSRAGRLPLTCFLRSDTTFQHVIKNRPGWIIGLNHWIEGFGIQGAQVVGVSGHLTRAVIQRHPRIRVLRAFSLPNDLPSSSSAGHNRQVEHPVSIAMVGILEPRKNQGFIIDLLSQMPDCDFRLFLYGTGPDQKHLSQLVEGYGLAHKVFFRGWQAAERIWPHVDVLLMPSLEEGMPNAVLEAIAHQVPVLASDIPAHREMLSADQLLPLDRPWKWKEMLLQLATRPEKEMNRIREKQTPVAEKFKFDWDASVVEVILMQKIEARTGDKFEARNSKYER